MLYLCIYSDTLKYKTYFIMAAVKKKDKKRIKVGLYSRVQKGLFGGTKRSHGPRNRLSPKRDYMYPKLDYTYPKLDYTHPKLDYSLKI